MTDAQGHRGLTRWWLNRRDPCSASAAAAARWMELQPALVSLQAADMYLPDAWSIGHDVLAANGDAGGATALLARATDWIEQTALRHVPPTYRDSFLHRNPVNRRLLTAASRSGNAA